VSVNSCLAFDFQVLASLSVCSISVFHHGFAVSDSLAILVVFWVASMSVS
jgi:hypothetical protein